MSAWKLAVAECCGEIVFPVFGLNGACAKYAFLRIAYMYLCSLLKETINSKRNLNFKM